MKTSGDQGFQHDFLFLRSCGEGGLSYGGFVWPLEVGAVVEAPDWDPSPVCGGGLHGIADGMGDWGLLKALSDDEAVWMVCGAKRSEAVELEGKVKVPRAVVLYAGSLPGALDMITPQMSARTRELVLERSRAANPGETATGPRGAASSTGYGGRWRGIARRSWRPAAGRISSTTVIGR